MARNRPMGIQKQSAVFVPQELLPELNKLSKAALLDIAWDYAKQNAQSELTADVLREFNARADLIKLYRKQAKECL